MRVNVIQYSKKHEHYYVFSQQDAVHKFVSCSLLTTDDKCASSRAAMPCGTLFDGVRNIEVNNIDIELYR